MKGKVLVADDEHVILKVIEEELTSEGFQVDLAYDGDEACQKINRVKYDFAILDIVMPQKDGLAVLREIKSSSPGTVTIIMTAYGSIDNAVQAIKIGAYDYLTKPFEIKSLLSKISEAKKLQEKMSSLNFAPSNREGFGERLIGKSKEINKLKDLILRIKNLDSTVLILGESGTGKGVVAKTIHDQSKRRHLPFIHVNCAVLPPNLIESELFGHEKGAFSGAIESKKGKFELAGRGTIFLDEISALDFNLQAKLLTVLQERKMERLGGLNPIPVQARFITASNINLEEAVRRKEFREDLYYRLNVITLECPPLRYRPEDIEPLTLYFVKKFNQKLNKNITKISPRVWEVLIRCKWFGNVRELENALESAIALSDGATLREENLPLRISNPATTESPEKEYLTLKVQELDTIKRALEKHDGHREKAARELGISRRTLQYKLNKFELRD